VCRHPDPAHDPATCTDRGKHPCGKWSTVATTDRERITAMFAGTTRNIGIACGPSGLLVVDEDSPDAFAKYVAGIGHQIPATFTVTTGKGRHYYLAAANGLELGNRTGALKGHGVDVRGKGGYVVGPGSLHATGRAPHGRERRGRGPVPAVARRGAHDPPSVHRGAYGWVRRAARGHPREAGRRERRAARRADALRDQHARPRAAARRGRGAHGRRLAPLRATARMRDAGAVGRGPRAPRRRL
jgi:Bifunctional DNA primase/polymerase, N-terminal